MDRAQRIGEGREPFAAQELGIEPFGKVGQAGDGLADGAAEELRRQACRQRIDRFQQRQARGLSDVDDMVGMNHRRPAVEPLHPAADEDGGADRKQLLEPRGLRMEEGERNLPGLVEGEDAVGNVRLAAWRRLMAVDLDLERDDRSARRAGDLGPVAAVYQAVRQHEQQIADARVARPGRHGHHIGDEFRRFCAHTVERGDVGKQRIEQGWSHWSRLGPANVRARLTSALVPYISRPIPEKVLK